MTTTMIMATARTNINQGNMLRRIHSFPLFLCLFLLACQSEKPVHSHEGEDAHAHGEDVTLSYTRWTDQTELFVEFQPLVLGEKTTFAAHFSEMQHFKAIREGKVTVSLVSGDKGIRNTVDAPASPGIFRPALKPKSAGIHQLIFDLKTSMMSDQIVLEGIQVYATHEEAHKAHPPEEEDPNEISFLKEQAWKIDFANAAVKRDTIREVIHTGGEFIATSGNEKTVSATAEGLLIYKKRNATIGSAVSKGELLFAVAGGGIMDRDLEVRFLQAKSRFETAKGNFERKQELMTAQAIGKPVFEEAKLEYELAQTEYNVLASNYSRGGKSIRASKSGFLKHLYQPEGAFVAAGEPLAVITENKTVTLRADVEPENYHQLNEVQSANFVSNGTTYRLEDFSGKLLSYGKSISHEQPKVPVYFELTNTADLLPGSFVEVFLKLRPVNDGLLVPASALLESYGNYSVVVQNKGESFALRDVKIGISNGSEVEILSGLKEGERVVSTGAFQVKMASMSGEVPAHGHSH